MKILFWQHSKFHCDRTILWQSCLYSGIFYAGQNAFSYWSVTLKINTKQHRETSCVVMNWCCWDIAGVRLTVSGLQVVVDVVVFPEVKCQQTLPFYLQVMFFHIDVTHWPLGDVVYELSQYISMAFCKTAVSPLLMNWSHHSLLLSHWYKVNKEVRNQFVFTISLQCESWVKLAISIQIWPQLKPK